MNHKSIKIFCISIICLGFISCSNMTNKNETLYNITIKENENGSISADKLTGIKAGEEIILTVTPKPSYTVKTISVINVLNKDMAVAAVKKDISYKFTMPDSDVIASAVFEKAEPLDITNPTDLNGENGNTLYRIEHYQQNSDDTETYTLVAIQKKKGYAGCLTNAVSQNYQGFYSLSFEQQIISVDGSTVIEIYYDRKKITYTFEPNGGNWDGNTQAVTINGLFGTNVQKPQNPTRLGYFFDSWDKTIPEVFGIENDIYTTIWLANTNTPYTVRVYIQDIDDTSIYILDEEIVETGTTDTNTNYTTLKTGFELKPVNQINISGDGSSVLDVYYDRVFYTVAFDTKGGTVLQNEQVLYGGIPIQIPEKEG